MTGGVKSEVQLMVRVAVAVLLHASVAVHVRVCVRVQPLLVMDPVTPLLGFGVTAPQLSVATAVPRAASICAAVGLQPRLPPLAIDPVVVITGAVKSEVQLMVREAVAELLHASVAVHVLVWVRVQPLLVMDPVTPLLGLGVTAPQLSVATAVPRAASI